MINSWISQFYELGYITHLDSDENTSHNIPYCHYNTLQFCVVLCHKFAPLLHLPSTTTGLYNKQGKNIPVSICSIVQKQ